MSSQDILNKASALAEKEGVKVETVQIENQGLPVSDAILREVERSSCDLIAMGTHGRRGLNRIILGSDAERVLRESTVPVLLTRAQETTAAEKSPARQAA
ncbi:MAG TPA: universal stress protein [Burkholderiales bacterium]|nr:universal stress protein [Burkholderiales bacterium]